MNAKRILQEIKQKSNLAVNIVKIGLFGEFIKKSNQWPKGFPWKGVHGCAPGKGLCKFFHPYGALQG